MVRQAGEVGLAAVEHSYFKDVPMPNQDQRRSC